MELNENIIKELIKSLNQSEIDKMEIETKEFKLRLSKNPAAMVSGVSARTAEVARPQAAAPCEAPAEQPREEPKGQIVTAPIVGTYYSAAAPDKPAFSKVGQKVKKGDILFIIESMKLMNEISSEWEGTVAEILAENGQPVEYGQPILRIE